MLGAELLEGKHRELFGDSQPHITFSDLPDRLSREIPGPVLLPALFHLLRDELVQILDPDGPRDILLDLRRLIPPIGFFQLQAPVVGQALGGAGFLS